jgi:hypothetical protein
LENQTKYNLAHEIYASPRSSYFNQNLIMNQGNNYKDFDSKFIDKKKSYQNSIMNIINKKQSNKNKIFDKNLNSQTSDRHYFDQKSNTSNHQMTNSTG